MGVSNALTHASSRKPSVLSDSDYDHEIALVDHTTSRGKSAEIVRTPPIDTSEASARRNSDSDLRKHLSLREEVARRRYTKYLEPREGAIAGQRIDAAGEPLSTETTLEDTENAVDLNQSDFDSSSRLRKSVQSERQAAIDILYENQRGLFLCGIPLFSSLALGAADAPPWTNIAFKASATNIKNAQVPDPSWEWVWKDWSINHTDDVDENGWEYSFMFSKKFSWHGPTWWNSFVRRRAWTRKRMKKSSLSNLTNVETGHNLNSDYFTIHSKRALSPSPSKEGSAHESRNSTGQREMEEILRGDISDIATLMKALRYSRIDREKTEAVENFIEHAGDDLYYLRERMHDIMSQFIFQASRRLLLSHLLRLVDEASAHRKMHEDEGTEEDPAEKEKIDNLQAALNAADEEVKRLEFWSDIKDMAEKGETKGAVDERQGWGDKWIGVDSSGPKVVISRPTIPVGEDVELEQRVKGISSVAGRPDKGKGKA